MQAFGHIVTDLASVDANRLACGERCGHPVQTRANSHSRPRAVDRIGVNSLSTRPDSQHAPARGVVSLLIEEPSITLATGTKEARLRQKDHACRSCN